MGCEQIPRSWGFWFGVGVELSLRPRQGGMLHVPVLKSLSPQKHYSAYLMVNMAIVLLTHH